MSRRFMWEIGLVVLGAAVGVAAVLLSRKAPSVEGEAPPAVAGDSGEPIPDAVAVVWRYRTKGPIVSSPVVIEGRLYIGSNDNRLHCVDAATGAPVWTFPTADDVEATPLLVDGRVFVGSADGKLYAVDADSGDGLWAYATGDRIVGGADSFRTPGGDLRVLVGSHDKKLHCVDAATGKGLWTVETENYVNGTPAVYEDVVVFGGCDGLVHVIDADSGETRREVSLGDAVFIASSVVVGRATAYVAHVDNGCAAVAIRSGEVLWTYKAKRSFFASPALAPDRVIVGGRDHLLRALDRENGEILWTYACRDNLDSSPVIAGGRVIVGSDDGRLYAVGLEKGELIWEYTLGGPITGTAAVAGGLVYVGCEDGTLYALGPRR